MNILYNYIIFHVTFITAFITWIKNEKYSILFHNGIHSMDKN